MDKAAQDKQLNYATQAIADAKKWLGYPDQYPFIIAALTQQAGHMLYEVAKLHQPPEEGVIDVNTIKPRREEDDARPDPGNS